jgi:hypothetical protein
MTPALVVTMVIVMGILVGLVAWAVVATRRRYVSIRMEREFVQKKAVERPAGYLDRGRSDPGVDTHMPSHPNSGSYWGTSSKLGGSKEGR